MSFYLDLNDVEGICFELAKIILTFNQPFPEFNTRYPGRLESALHAPQRKVMGNEMYKTLTAKAAVFFYEMVKLHPFMNGNKRMACTSTFSFLYLNSHWVKMSWQDLYDLANLVAKSKPDQKELIIELLEKTFSERLVKVDLNLPPLQPWLDNSGSSTYNIQI